MTETAKRSDQLKSMSLNHYQEFDEIHLVLECASPESADLVFGVIKASMRAGTMNFGGMTFSPVEFETEETQ